MYIIYTIQCKQTEYSNYYDVLFPCDIQWYSHLRLLQKHFISFFHNISSCPEHVPARHHSVEAHPELVEGLQYSARNSGLQQQSDAACEGLRIRDQVSR